MGAHSSLSEHENASSDARRLHETCAAMVERVGRPDLAARDWICFLFTTKHYAQPLQC